MESVSDRKDMFRTDQISLDSDSSLYESIKRLTDDFCIIDANLKFHKK